jgi:hypothetical protein
MSVPKSLSTKDDLYSTSEMHGASTSRPPWRKANTSGFAEYGKWYLGVNSEKPENTKGHHEFPYGDFKDVHRCGVLAAESRAGQYQHYDIENAAAHLHGMMESRKAASASKRSRAASAGKSVHGARHTVR